MDLNEILFILYFLGIFFILGLKLYNIYHKGEKMGIAVSLFTFAVFWIFWFIGLAVYLTGFVDPTFMDGAGLLYATLFMFGNLFILVNIAFTVVEILFNFAYGSQTAYTANFSNENL